MTREIKINVTDDNILNGDQQSDNCPVSRAGHDAGFEFVNVTYGWMHLYRKCWDHKTRIRIKTPDAVRDFAIKFDAGNGGEPFSFSIAV